MREIIEEYGIGLAMLGIGSALIAVVTQFFAVI